MLGESAAALPGGAGRFFPPGVPSHPDVPAQSNLQSLFYELCNARLLIGPHFLSRQTGFVALQLFARSRDVSSLLKITALFRLEKIVTFSENSDV